MLIWCLQSDGVIDSRGPTHSGWDWWGGTGELFDTNRGLQTVAVNRMVASLDRIIEAPWPTGFDLVQ